MSKKDALLLTGIQELSEAEIKARAEHGAILKAEDTGTIMYRLDSKVIRLTDGQEAIIVPVETSRKFIDAYCRARSACVEEYAGLPADKCPLANEAGDACTVTSVQNMTAEELKTAMLKIAFGTKKKQEGATQ